MSKVVSIESFVLKTLQLLEQERTTEIEETKVLTERLPSKELQRRGVCLLKLHIGNRKSGMFGRVIIIFETHLESLPSHSFTPGDIVGLNLSSSDSQSESLGSGIVTRVSQSAVSVAFDESHDMFSLDDGPHDYYKLTKLANDVTYKRLKRTLNSLNKVSHEACSHLVSVLFGEQTLSPALQIPEITFFNVGLDASQRDAVTFALSQKEVAVVHGPPGTGKTTTVIEIILQAIKLKNKVLACAPSNIAVDNLVERLARSKHKIVRLGHPARLLPHIQKYSLDAILSTSDETRLVEDVRKDLDKALSGWKKAKNPGERRKMREEMKYLRKELRQREAAATKDILKRADVVLVTLTSATDDGPMKLLEESHFDVTVIDEVSQAMEAACWIPLLRSRKCILAGDHLQLPPTILSKQAAADGLEVTLMERVLDIHGDKVMRMLTTQYRMNEKIMQWSSTLLYESKLLADDSVKHHLLKDMADVREDELTSLPLLYIDTAGCDLHELDLPEEISKGNEGEADIVKIHIDRLVETGLAPEHIAVIAPYNLQVELIRLRLANSYPKLEVKSVDGFQGREKEAVIISLVRSNEKGEVGFLSERRRINVAVTRARRHLAVVGDSVTVSTDTFLKSLIDYLNTEGEVHSAHQYMNDGFSPGDSSTYRPEHLDDLLSIPKTSSADKGARPKVPRQPVNKPKSAGTNRTEPQNQTEKGGKPKAQQKTDEIDMNEDRVKELQSQLTEFQANQSLNQLEFPTTLSGRDRFLVHELSEKLGLCHSSKGVGEARHIVVSRPAAPERNTETPYDKASKDSVDTIKSVSDTMVSATTVSDQTIDGELTENVKNVSNNIDGEGDNVNDGTTSSQKKKNKKKKRKNKNEGNEGEMADMLETETGMQTETGKQTETQKGHEFDNDKENAATKTEGDLGNSMNEGQSLPISIGGSNGKIRCRTCGKDVIKANIQLHEIHCARKAKDSQSGASDNRSSAVNVKSKEVSKTSKFRKFDKELAERVDKVDKDDIDALITAVKGMDNFCCMKKCKTSVQTLYQTCEHCQGRYCLSHHIPEVHGCGDAARAQARARISRDGVLHRGSGTPDRRLDSARKAHLQRKLDSKMSDLSDKRKGKPKK